METSCADADAFADLLLAMGAVTDSPQELLEEYRAFLEWYSANGELRSFLGAGEVTGEGKRAALEGILRGRVASPIVYFVLLLQERGGMHLAARIEALVRRRIEVRGGGSAGELLCAAPLTDEQVSLIEAEVGRILGREAKLRVRHDPSLIGGCVVRAGHFVFDWSVQSRLARIGESLAAG
ncbi:MAG: F0F1 ATP synthase subunit delta [Lentisphaerae bacterium]|nr:F0F1 ATP synthase subunit delta [Lentisphaerota bacterium]